MTRRPPTTAFPNRLIVSLLALASVLCSNVAADEQTFEIAGGSAVVYTKPGPDRRTPSTLLIHFHGAPATVRTAFDRSAADAVLMIVNFPGLSSAYSTPFAEDPTLFETLNRRARALTGAETDRADFQQVVLSSFSAGYGAVREILKTPRHVETIDALVAADSIYAGLDDDADGRQVNAEQMRGFLEFARLASEGKKTFVLSHSAQPTPYASTTETADYLLRSLGLQRTADATIDLPMLHQQTQASRGGFVVVGFAGTRGEDHMQHLHHIDLLWDRFNDQASAPGSPSRPAAPD